MMLSYWFGDSVDGEWRPFRGDVSAFAGRVAALQTGRKGCPQPDWREAVACGACSDRAGYIGQLKEICIFLAQQKIEEEYRGSDVALLQMVRTLDELDTVINALTERAVEWYQVSNPAYSRKYRRTPPRTLIRTIARRSGGALSSVTADIGRLSLTRRALAREVSAAALNVMPNCSALIGGLVAARLLFHAGGLLPLARLPASAIQVLGAKTALFSHLRTRTPPPKHGIIFQHRRVHNAPLPVRGKTARVLAAKLAIAARIDFYRGSADPDFLEEAQARIDAAGAMP